MEEEEARLALLQTELNSIQNSIRGLDATTFQIKGWCVTTCLAVGGFAVAYHKPALLLIGGAAALGFYLINCQFKMIQRPFINRNLEIDSELKHTGIIQFLKGAGSFEVVGTAAQRYSPVSPRSISKRVRNGLPRFWFEASIFNTFSLYLFIAFCLMIEAIILLA